jgi:hypothetical protein
MTAPSSSRSDAPIYAALIAAALYALFAFGSWEFRHRDISAFVVAGGPGIDAAHAPRELTIFPSGFDGMAFFQLALNPFSRSQSTHGLTLDNPPYRQQRIGYPLIVWLLSGFGNVRLVLWMLVIVNIIAAAVVGFSGGVLARQFGVHALWGVLFALYPGFLLSLSRDTCEIVACAFVLAGVAATRPALSALLMSCAVLTRETTLVIVAALAFEWLIRRTRPFVVWAIPAAVFALWQAYLGFVWGTVPVRAGSFALAVPFGEYVQHVVKALPRHTHVQRFDLVECAFLALIVVLAAIPSRAPLFWRFAWLADLALASVLPHETWAEDWSYLRVLAELFVVSAALIVAGRHLALRIIALLAAAGLWWYLMSNLLDLA